MWSEQVLKLNGVEIRTSPKSSLKSVKRKDVRDASSAEHIRALWYNQFSQDQRTCDVTYMRPDLLFNMTFKLYLILDLLPCPLQISNRWGVVAGVSRFTSHEARSGITKNSAHAKRDRSGFGHLSLSTAARHFNNTLSRGVTYH